MTGAGLQWRELANLNENAIQSYDEFRKELLNYFEPVNRELTVRKMLSDLKQMGKLTLVREYNREFSRWLMQIPGMTVPEQTFHYSQGLKTRTRVEVEGAELQSLQNAMKIMIGLIVSLAVVRTTMDWRDQRLISPLRLQQCKLGTCNHAEVRNCPRQRNCKELSITYASSVVKETA